MWFVDLLLFGNTQRLKTKRLLIFDQKKDHEDDVKKISVVMVVRFSKYDIQSRICESRMIELRVLWSLAKIMQVSPDLEE